MVSCDDFSLVFITSRLLMNRSIHIYFRVLFMRYFGRLLYESATTGL